MAGTIKPDAGLGVTLSRCSRWPRCCRRRRWRGRSGRCRRSRALPAASPRPAPAAPARTARRSTERSISRRARTGNRYVSSNAQTRWRSWTGRPRPRLPRRPTRSPRPWPASSSPPAASRRRLPRLPSTPAPRQAAPPARRASRLRFTLSEPAAARPDRARPTRPPGRQTLQALKPQAARAAPLHALQAQRDAHPPRPPGWPQHDPVQRTDRQARVGSRPLPSHRHRHRPGRQPIRAEAREVHDRAPLLVIRWARTRGCGYGVWRKTATTAISRYPNAATCGERSARHTTTM
jgi:hypothetical protein